MMKLNYVIQLSLVTGMLFLLTCASSDSFQYSSGYGGDIDELKLKVNANPRDSEALRELGVAYFDIAEYRKARSQLIKSFKLNPRDPKTTLYLGMTLEADNLDKLAFKIYKRYIKMPRNSEYYGMIEAKYTLLSRKMLQQDMRNKLQQASYIPGDRSNLSKNAIAVFPIEFHGGKEDYAPLGKGLSEMLITDLSQVPKLTLIERVRLQALLEEISLTETGVIDESTAPRYGHLVSAGKIIHGNYAVDRNDNVRLEFALWDVSNNNFPGYKYQNDALDNFFKMEKDIAFSIIDEMGIKLTPLQRERIQRVPTKNLQAFMAYCMGLEMEDAGQFEAAYQHYKKAVKIDPNFSKANQKADVCQTLALMTDATPHSMAMASQKGYTSSSPFASSAKRFNMIQGRLQNLSTSLGTGFIPGQDSRKPVEESKLFDNLQFPPPHPEDR